MGFKAKRWTKENHTTTIQPSLRDSRPLHQQPAVDFDVKSKLITSSVEPINGIPQLVYKLPLDKSIDPILEDIDFSKIFDRLIIGPSQFSIAMSAAFVNALSQIGVPEARKKVFASHIPIRS